MSDEDITQIVTEVEQVGPNDTQPFRNVPERARRVWVPSVWESGGGPGGSPKVSGGYEADKVSGVPVPRAFNRPDQRYAQDEATLQVSRSARAVTEYSASVILVGADGIYEVRSASGNNYDVSGDLSACDCPDFWRLQQSGKLSVFCKHIAMVSIALSDPLLPDGIPYSADKLAQDAGVSVEAVRYACQQGVISAAKVHGVWVIPPSQSSVLTFLFTRLVPVLETMLPAVASVGDPNTPVSITGTGFCLYSRIVWDISIPLVTTFISPTEVQATIPAARLLSPGTFTVRVENAFKGGATSNTADFTVS